MGNGVISTHVREDIDSTHHQKKSSHPSSSLSSINFVIPSSSPQFIQQLEQKIQKNYYQKHPDEYREEVIEALQSDDIARMEILLKFNQIQSLLPLHLAIKYQAIECLELLLSAGLSALSIDKNGATPLHRAVSVIEPRSEERNSTASSSSNPLLLCIYSLLLHTPKCINCRDMKGNTPLHNAIIANNLPAVEILLTQGASYTLTNAAGHTPRYLAKSMKLMNIVELIDLKKAGKPFPRRDDPSPVEMERIMKVWERFFENALSGINFQEIEEDMSDDGGGKWPSNDDGGKWPSNDDNYDQDGQDQYENYQTSDEIYSAACWWFGHVLCYDAALIIADDTIDLPSEYPPGSTDGYYIASCIDLSERHQDIDDYLYHQENYQIWRGYSHAQQEEDHLWNTTGETWPTTIVDSIRRGWITCYLLDTNECVWLHLLTYNIERYLPIGYDELSGQCGCEWGDEVGYWLKPPQVAARAWLMVRCNLSTDGEYAKDEMKSDSLSIEKKSSKLSDLVADEKNHNDDDDWIAEKKTSSRDHEQQKGTKDDKDELEEISSSKDQEAWYYFNRVSGQSSWFEPNGWREIVTLAGGWILCAEESHIEDMYWWNENTDERMWYVEDYS